MTLRATVPAPYGLATAAGRNRERSEDAALAGPTWFIVADGMGGHAAGDVASRTAVETFEQTPPPFESAREASRDAVAAIVAACERANTAIRRRAAADHTIGMGATLVGLVQPLGSERPGRTMVFHVGDSRCYRLVDGTLRLLTRDHSHVQELIDAGRLTTEHALRHPLRNVVTRAVGIDPTVVPDIVELADGTGRYLLCTDGLTAEIGPRTIGRVLTGVPDAHEAAARLVELALDGGAHDDITALVVDVDCHARSDLRSDFRSAHHTTD
jgi:serine/threonine protein phosphatase PrpC